MESTAIAQGRNLVRVPLRSIVPGKNPRQYFDPGFIEELAASIKAQGVLQTPLCRPTVLDSGERGHEIVAGEQRIRACRLAYGEDADIEIDLRDFTDAQAEAGSATENIIRRPMTPLEEAEAAARSLGHCQGDRQEAARRLGWRLDALNKRLGLMNATPLVRDALRTNAIKLGHAELLATMRKEAQDATLELLLEKKPQSTVVELKALLEKAALVLNQAIFDKAECAGCQHNSSNQTVLFAEAITGGKCTNKSCFDAKAEAELQARAEALRSDYQVVRIVRPGENFTIIPLQAEGAKGVGAEQAANCRLCKDFGAVVSAVPDKLGNTYKDMCLNVACNAQKVAHQQRLSVPPAPSSSGTTPAASATADTADTADSANAADGKPQGKVKQTQPEGKADLADPRQGVKEYREQLWRAIYKQAMLKLMPAQNRAVLLALCLTRPSVIDSAGLAADASKVAGVLDTGSPASLVESILALEHKPLAELTHRIAANVGAGQHGGLELHNVTGILQVFGVQVAAYWKIGKPFLELLTKNEIDAVAEEIGLKQHMGAEYTKARNGPKAAYVEAVLACGFDFTGKVPKFMDLPGAAR